MGREIRMVPPNWEHPKYTEEECGYRNRTTNDYKPMYDQSFKEAATEWKEGYKKWYEGGKQQEKADIFGEDCEYWEYDTPPDPDYYRPAFTEEPTWYQVYQTVSEGTPVTPPFATQDELIDYLVNQGDFWYQKDVAERGNSNFRSKYSVEAATAFVKGVGWAPSLVVVNSPSGVTVQDGIEALGNR